jgi:multiple sugar transport system substrate-binding protein
VQVAYVQAGAVPVISGLGEAQFGKDDRYRFLEALSDNSKNSVFYAPVKERVEINDLIGLKVNQALLGELTPKEALNQAAEGIFEIARKAGYKTGRGEIL